MSFFVRVSVSPKLPSAGLSADAVQTDVALRLRSAGVRVVTKSEASSAPGSGCLQVTVAGGQNVTSSGEQRYHSAVVLDFLQKVRLVRDPSLELPAATWHMGRTGAGPRAEASESIRQQVRDLSDKFANAYLSVNPARREEPKP